MQVVDYFSVLSEVEYLTRENRKLSDLLHAQSSANGSDSEDNLFLCSFTPIMRQIVANAKKNAHRLPHGQRHPEMFKKFSNSLFIYAGPLAYDFLQQILSHAFPSHRTVQRLVQSEYKTLH